MNDQLTFLTPSASRRKLTVAPHQRPAARIREVGPTYLSDIEILTAVARTPGDYAIAHQLLDQFDGLPGLARAALPQLTAVPGIGESIAAAIVAAFELGRRLARASYDPSATIKNPEDAASLLVPLLRDKTREHFVVLLLNIRNHVLKTHTLYQGTVDTSLVRIAEVFQLALTYNAPQIMVAHNHPSGEARPSPEDIALTRRIVQAGKLLEVNVLDHIVVGGNTGYSLRRHGLGFDESTSNAFSAKETARAVHSSASRRQKDTLTPSTKHHQHKGAKQCLV